MRPDSHEIFARRRSRNVGVGLALGAFALLVFAVSVVKLTDRPPIERHDPGLRQELVPDAAGD